MKNLKNRLPAPCVDYRKFRFSKINTPEYRHLWFLLFWPIYWLRYPLIEALNTPDRCFPISCAIDGMIPFCEYFLIAYGLWMVCMLATAAYTLLYDVESFCKYSKFLIVAFSISTLTYLIWPTCQNLRPETFARDNIFTKIVGYMYAVDTNTNVCPSEHVIGSLAFLIAAIHTKSLRTPGKMAIITILSVVISLSTVFLKQHSFVDVMAAIPVCLVAYLIVYVRRPAPATADTAAELQ